jgi:SAM-dependent methyltransferase
MMTADAGKTPGRSQKLRSLLGPVFKTINHARCRAWDLTHGVDTCGEIPLTSLDFQSRNRTPGLEYQSHHPEIIRSSLLLLPIQHRDYTFVDFGCGKGRVLLIASEFEFRKIIGLELAPQLAEIALRNVGSYRAARQKCSYIEVLTADATDYELAAENQVLYFFSPFTLNLMSQILEKIEDSLQRSPRDLLILFSGVMARRDSAFASRARFERLRRERYVDLYRYRR